MKYFYKTDSGTFSIRPDPILIGGYRLYIDDVYLGDYRTPSLAAGDVYDCQTGWPDWDKRIVVKHPADLDEWTATR